MGTSNKDMDASPLSPCPPHLEKNVQTPNALAPIIILKPWSNNNDNNKDNDMDTMITSASKNHNNHNVVFFVLVAVVIEAADNGGTCPHGHLPMLTLSRISRPCAKRRRGGDPLSLKLQSMTIVMTTTTMRMLCLPA
jgi:hypothetical protein